MMQNNKIGITIELIAVRYVFLNFRGKYCIKMLLCKWITYPFITNHYKMSCLKPMTIFYELLQLYLWQRLVRKSPLHSMWHHLGSLKDSWMVELFGYTLTHSLTHMFDGLILTFVVGLIKGLSADSPPCGCLASWQYGGWLPKMIILKENRKSYVVFHPQKLYLITSVILQKEDKCILPGDSRVAKF